MENQTLVQALSSALRAIKNCEVSGNAEMAREWRDYIEWLCKNHAPSGSGIDCGTKLNFDASNYAKIVFIVEFHHMNDAGMYDGWTQHTVRVEPEFNGVDIWVSGRDRNGIKDYLADVYSHAVIQPVPNLAGYRAAR